VKKFTICCVGFTVENVLENRIVENDWLLHDKRNGVSEIIKINVFDVYSIEKDLTLINVVESHKEVNESTLSTSTFSHKCNGLSWFNLKRETS